MKKSYGFTLIELLVVVIVLAALSGVMLSIVNITRSQGIARDGIRKTNVERLAMSVESYIQAEGSFPTVAESADPASVLRTVYISNWPQGLDDSGKLDPLWDYVYFTPAGNSYFVVVTKNSVGKGCFKYSNLWNEIRDCATCDTGNSC